MSSLIICMRAPSYVNFLYFICAVRDGVKDYEILSHYFTKEKMQFSHDFFGHLFDFNFFPVTNVKTMKTDWHIERNNMNFNDLFKHYDLSKRNGCIRKIKNTKF